MRPKSIFAFDVIYIGGILVYLVYHLVMLDEIAALGLVDAREIMGPGRYHPGRAEEMMETIKLGSVVGLLFTIAFSGVLWFFISIRASTLAKWIYIILSALSLFFAVMMFPLYGRVDIHSLMPLITSGLCVASIICLFTDEASEWFAEKKGVGYVPPPNGVTFR